MAQAGAYEAVDEFHQLRTENDSLRAIRGTKLRIFKMSLMEEALFCDCHMASQR